MNHVHIVLLAGILSLFLAGCSYQVATKVSPAVSVMTHHAEKSVPGRYALYVDANAMQTTYKPQSLACSITSSYPIDARRTMVQSALQTFQRLTAKVELVPSKLTREQLAERGFDRQISLVAADFKGSLHIDAGFWSISTEARSEVSARVSVENGRETLLSFSEEGDEAIIQRRYMAMLCGSAAQEIGKAAEGAIRELLEQVAERFLNAEQLR